MNLGFCRTVVKLILVCFVLSTVLVSGSLYALTPEEKAWKEDILSLLKLVGTPGDYADLVNLIEAAPGLKEDENIRKAYLDALPEGATLPTWALEKEKEVEAEALAEAEELAREIEIREEAKEVLKAEEAKRTEEEAIRRHYKSGKNYYRDGKYQEAIGEFEKVLALNPKHLGASRYLKRSQTRLARAQEVKPKVLPEERAELPPKPAQDLAVEDLYDLGVHYYQNSQYQEAVDQFKKVLALRPGYKRAGEYIKKSQAGLAKEKAEEELTLRKAEVELERALALDPEYKKRREYIERARAKVERIARAQKAREIRNHYNLGRYLYDRSRRYLEYLERGYYDYPHVYSEFGKAIGEFETVLKLNPKHRGARGYLAKSQAKLVRMKVLEKAKREAQERKKQIELAEAERERIETHYRLGKEYYRQHQYERAIGEFEDILAIDYNHAGARRYIAKSKERLREIALAKAKLAKEETEVVSKAKEMERIKEELLATPSVPEDPVEEEVIPEVSAPPALPVETKAPEEEAVLPELAPAPLEASPQEAPKEVVVAAVPKQILKPAPLPPGATIIKSTNVVNNIEVESSDGKARVVITLDGPAAYKVGKLIKPQTLFIDISDTISGLSSERIPVNSEIIREIRSVQYRVVPREEFRVMIDLAKWIGYKVTSQGNRIYVEFGNW